MVGLYWVRLRGLFPHSSRGEDGLSDAGWPTARSLGHPSAANRPLKVRVRLRTVLGDVEALDLFLRRHPQSDRRPNGREKRETRDHAEREHRRHDHEGNQNYRGFKASYSVFLANR